MSTVHLMSIVVPALAGFFGGIIGASLILLLERRRERAAVDPTQLRETSSSWNRK